MSDLGTIYANIRFWQQIEGDAKRTVICEPHKAAEVQAAVEERGYGRIVTVLASPCCPAGQMLVIDDPAIEASSRQALQRSIRSMYR